MYAAHLLALPCWQFLKSPLSQSFFELLSEISFYGFYTYFGNIPISFGYRAACSIFLLL